MARTLSIFIAAGVLLVAAACMTTARSQSLFFDAPQPANSASAAAVTVNS